MSDEQVIFGEDDEAEENGDLYDNENYVGMDEVQDPEDSDEDSEEVQNSEDENMTEDEDQGTDESTQNQQKTMNGKSVQENVKERSVWKTVTLGAVSSGNMSIMRKEDENWIPFSDDLSTIDKDEMSERLKSLQENKDVWGEAIQLQLINKGDMDNPEMRFIDYQIPDEEDIPEDFEPAEDDEDQSSGNSSRNRSRDQSSSNSSESSSSSDAPRFRALLKVRKDDEDLEYTGHATAEDPQSPSQLLELAETRAIKRAIKFTPALYQDDQDVDPAEADKADCLQALNSWADSYQIQTEQIKEGDL